MPAYNPPYTGYSYPYPKGAGFFHVYDPSRDVYSRDFVPGVWYGELNGVFQGYDADGSLKITDQNGNDRTIPTGYTLPTFELTWPWSAGTGGYQNLGEQLSWAYARQMPGGPIHDPYATEFGRFQFANPTGGTGTGGSGTNGPIYPQPPQMPTIPGGMVPPPVFTPPTGGGGYPNPGQPGVGGIGGTGGGTGGTPPYGTDPNNYFPGPTPGAPTAPSYPTSGGAPAYSYYATAPTVPGTDPNNFYPGPTPGVTAPVTTKGLLSPTLSTQSATQTPTGTGITPTTINTAFSGGQPYDPSAALAAESQPGAYYDPWAASGTQSPAQQAYAVDPSNVMMYLLGFTNLQGDYNVPQVLDPGWSTMYSK